MSSQASKAELYRILNSGEKDLERSSGYEVRGPRNEIDTTFFDHVGAIFGPRKDSYPNYPDHVDLPDNEAAMQPGSAKPCSHYNHQPRSTPERGLLQSLPLPTLTSTQEAPFRLPTQYEPLEPQNLAQTKGLESVQSCRTHERSPAQSQNVSPATTTIGTGHHGEAHDTFLHHDAIPEERSDRDTASHHSFASVENKEHGGGVAPFPPQPFTTYNLYRTYDNTNEQWGAGYTW